MFVRVPWHLTLSCAGAAEWDSLLCPLGLHGLKQALTLHTSFPNLKILIERQAGWRLYTWQNVAIWETTKSQRTRRTGEKLTRGHMSFFSISDLQAHTWTRSGYTRLLPAFRSSPGRQMIDPRPSLIKHTNHLKQQKGIREYWMSFGSFPLIISEEKCCYFLRKK